MQIAADRLCTLEDPVVARNEVVGAAGGGLREVVVVAPASFRGGIACYLDKRLPVGLRRANAPERLRLDTTRLADCGVVMSVDLHERFTGDCKFDEFGDPCILEDRPAVLALAGETLDLVDDDRVVEDDEFPLGPHLREQVWVPVVEHP